MNGRRATVYLGCLLLCCALLGLAAAPAEAQEPKYGGTLVVGIPVDPFTLNPILTTSLHTAYVTAQIYNRLIDVDWNGNPLPSLATAWEVSADGLKYTFRLGKNILWNDGKPFTSEDVKFSIEAIARVHPAGKANFGSVNRVETPDPSTAVIVLKNPFPPLLEVLSRAQMASIIPKHIYDGKDITTNPHNTLNPVGTGPFMVKEWIKGDHLTLERNPRFFKKNQPYLDRIIFKIFADAATQLTAFEAGDLDYLPWNLPPHEAKRLEKDAKFAVKSFPAGNMFSHMIGFNLTRPYLKDLKVRQAIAHAIDKAHLLSTVDYGFGVVKDSPVTNAPATAWLYNPSVRKYPFDLKRAEQLLDEAGYPRKSGGSRFQLSVVNTFADPSVVKNTEIIRDWLRRVGIDLKIETMDTATGFERVFKRWDYDLWYYMMSTGPDPQVNLRRFYHSENMQHNAGVVNATSYSTPKVDELFNLAAKTVDQKKRAEHYREFQKIVMDDLPYLPIYNVYSVQAVRKDYVGIPVGFLAPMEGMESVWWSQGKATR